MKINYNILFGCLIISIGIIIQGYIVNLNTDTSLNNERINNRYEGVLDMNEATEYLNMNESEIKRLITIEKYQLEKYKTFTGEMLPYFQVGDKYYFYKETLDRWLTDITEDRRKYDTKENVVY
ncbi:MerR family transcriptional regulator [Anaeromicrobium sediminis]|uniref:Uncharacterized protein n=1 Tax=Anaeromicrobium sediminis TaxID=1478221 RepID=A0A267MCR7_9FIRM|nr:helix-turn-helix domain-containing protein [Anaeromicrobium sediminis]PAB57384.1 hypothetical protein CCE28_18990 [Anaeromicrobium sediminis]